ncbi:MAG TPA: HlyD family efflux transporter periplasmic adaptor subunit [Bryobacteraceae bacterium]|nr:HlyD family efflux transporter periplasmic adaptor subunit [Bryobacteraceae bacterium]
MDIQRQGVARRKMIRRIIYVVLIAIAVPLITWGLSRLKPAAPTVELATLWPDTVKRGPMIRDVRGLGTLRPEEVMWIPAAFDSRVEKIELLPGVKVSPNTVIMVLSNPQMELDANDLEWQVKIAQANYDDLKVKLENQTLDQKSTTANLKSQDTEAKLTADRDQELLKLGLKPDLDVKISVSKSQELDERYEIEQEKLTAMKQSVEAQLAAQKVLIEKLKAAWDLKKKQVEQLTIRAGTDGMLQEVPVEVGQRVPAGTILAKVAQQGKLKAELKISETQAKDIQLGQRAEIDTRNGIIPGHVSRIDPAVINGTVTVDVKLEGPLPEGARPDLSVDGTVILERLPNVVYVGRPVFGQANSVVTLFKIDPDGKGATRVQVKFGKSAVNTIEVLEGLKVGDRVILSDMSAWDAQNRIRLD